MLLGLLINNKTSQKEMAEYMGLPLRTLENWIYRDIYPILPDSYRMAQFLGVSMEYLLTGREKNDQTKINIIRGMLKRTDEKLRKL